MRYFVIPDRSLAGATTRSKGQPLRRVPDVESNLRRAGVSATIPYRWQRHEGQVPVAGDGAPATDDMELIRGSEFFQSMPPDKLAEMLETCRVRTLPPGRIAFHQGDEAKTFFVVLEGWVKVTKPTVGGDLMVRRIVRSGGTLAEAAAFSTGQYPGTAEALSMTRLLEVPLAWVVDALGGRGSVAFAMVMGMARQAERTAGLLEQAFQFTAPQRLAAYLVNLLTGETSLAATRLPYDKCLLALSLGMTPETLSRAFATLRPLGVKTRNRDVLVEDVELLCRFCEMETWSSG